MISLTGAGDMSRINSRPDAILLSRDFMSALPRTNHRFFGLLELDAAGTVLYYRIEGNSDKGAGALPDISGSNFFTEVAPFANREEFRRLVESFRTREASSESLNFTCQFADGAEPVRVLLARVRERTDDNCTKSVLVHIRQARETANQAA